jgi:hypothetical protein
MSDIKVIGGSCDRKLRWSFSGNGIRAVDKMKWSLPVVHKYHIKHGLIELALADESSGVKVLGAAGWGAAGALIAGPLGAVVGGILGGRGENVTFVAKFRDEKTMVGQVPKKVWVKMLAERV